MEKVYVTIAVLAGVVLTAWITWWTPICFGLAALGWNMMATWDHMGDIWHRGLIVSLLFIVAFLAGGLAATISRYREARKAWREPEAEEPPLRTDTGALLAIQVVKQPAGDSLTQQERLNLTLFRDSSPVMQEARIGFFPQDWMLEYIETAMERFALEKKRGQV